MSVNNKWFCKYIRITFFFSVNKKNYLVWKRNCPKRLDNSRFKYSEIYRKNSLDANVKYWKDKLQATIKRFIKCIGFVSWISGRTKKWLFDPPQKERKWSHKMLYQRELTNARWASLRLVESNSLTDATTAFKNWHIWTLANEPTSSTTGINTRTDLLDHWKVQ